MAASTSLLNMSSTVSSGFTEVWRQSSRLFHPTSSSSMSASSSSSTTSLLHNVEQVLNMNTPLYNRLNDVVTLIKGHPALHPRDLDRLFVLLLDDVLRRWRLLWPSCHRGYNDVEAISRFLSSKGPFFTLIILPLSQRHDNNVYQLPNNQVVATALEMYFYHFLSMPLNVDVGSKENGLLDSVYLTLYDDYLNHFLPQSISQPLYKAIFFNHKSSNTDDRLKSDETSLSLSTPRRLIKMDALLTNESTLLRSRRASDSLWAMSTPITMSSNTSNWPTKVLVQMVQRQWMRSDVLPTQDTLKLLRLTIKHLHGVYCSVRGNDFVHYSNHDVFMQRLLGDNSFRVSLFQCLDHLFDHWPLDGSFRIVLETWLSFIQPWRYKGDSVSSTDIRSWRIDFIEPNLNFYHHFTAKTCLRLLRVDLATPKNSLMFFRLLKVLSQENLIEAIKDSVYHRNGNEGFDIFTSDFKEQVLEPLATLAIKSRFTRMQIKKKTVENNDQSPLKAILKYFESLFESQVDPNEEETSMVLQNLDASIAKMKEIFRVNPTVLDESNVKSGRMQEDKKDDEMEEGWGRGLSDSLDSSQYRLSPQQRWDLINNRGHKQDFKYDGHPDLIPLRNDENHFLASQLVTLSTRLNNSFDFEHLYFQSSVKGLITRHICQPPTVYRGRQEMRPKCYGSPPQMISLPPRLVLRPLASNRALVYTALFLLLCFWMGVIGTLKLVAALIFFWVLYLFVEGYKETRRRSQEDENSFTMSPERST